MSRAFCSRALLVVALVTPGFVIFWPFLVGEALLLYKDIGSDSLLSYYPEFVHLSHYARTAGYPSWSFYVGMGQDLAYLAGYLFWQPVTWLPKAWIAHALVWQHLAKVLLVGLIFYRFLVMRRLRSPAPLLGALLVAFSAYMTSGSCWYPLADEVIGFAALMLAIERALQDGRWLLLAFVVAAIGLLNPFFLYLCALFLVCYVPLRLFAVAGWQPRTTLRTCLLLALVSMGGAALSAFVTLPCLHVIMNSPRGAGTLAATHPLLATPVFTLQSASHYFTAIFRAISNEMAGTGDQFRGWHNYLEAPLIYCGIVTLLLAPQLVGVGTRPGRIVTLVLCALIIPTVFPWFRYLFWLFEGDYYRTYSLFWILALITLSMIGFSRYIAGSKLNLALLGGTTVPILAAIHLPLGEAQALIQPQVRTAATIYLIGYTIVLIGGQLLSRRKLAGSIVVAITLVELVHFNSIAVTKREIVTKTELASRTTYNDETVNVLKELSTNDRSFFRLTKPQASLETRWSNLNEAMIFSFYGTSSYSSFNNANYANFLIALGTMPPGSEEATRWSVGLLRDPLLSTFACEKYSLVDDAASYRGILRYEFVKQYGRRFLFRNQLSLPLGLAFTRTMTENSFSQLPSDQKAEALFRVAVLAKDDLPGVGLSSISSIELAEEIKDTPLSYLITARGETALKLTSFQQSKITGTIRLDQKTVLVLQTPFDRGWTAFANGKAVRTLKVDAGLLGLVLDAGEQQVAVHYRNPRLTLGIIVSALSLCLLVLALRKWPRLIGPPLLGAPVVTSTAP